VNIVLDVQPFRGVRYTAAAGPWPSVVAPPYDVIDDVLRQKLAAANPYNIVQVDIAADGYDEAARRWNAWLRSGIVARESRPAFYAYQQVYNTSGSQRRLRWGLAAAVKLAAYEEGVVLPHERTLARAKQDRLQLMRATRAQLSPVFGLCFGTGGDLDARLSAACAGPPAAEVADADGVEHRLWVLDDPELVRELQALLRPARVVIADGHHRYETALAFRDEQRAKLHGGWPERAAWNYVLMVLVDVDSPGMAIWPTHRIVRWLPCAEPEELRRHWSGLFRLAPVEGAAPGIAAAEAARALENALAACREPGFAAYLRDGRGFVAALADPSAWRGAYADKPAAWRALDVAVVHGLALPAAGLDEAAQASGEALSFTRSAAEAVAAVQRGEAAAALLVRPAPPQAVRDVALAGETLPQKSTYFYPKLLTGLVMSDLDTPVGL